MTPKPITYPNERTRLIETFHHAVIERMAAISSNFGLAMYEEKYQVARKELDEYIAKLEKGIQP